MKLNVESISLSTPLPPPLSLVLPLLLLLLLMMMMTSMVTLMKVMESLGKYSISEKYLFIMEK